MKNRNLRNKKEAVKTRNRKFINYVICKTAEFFRRLIHGQEGGIMDITKRQITKIAREAEKVVLLTLREEGVGTAEIDLIHAVRHNPGCTQAELAAILHADKAAVARRTKNLEAKGYLVRTDDPNDKRSRLLFPTPKAEELKASKADIESSFYEFLTSSLSEEEAASFAAVLNKIYTASKAERRAGFPHFIK